MSAKTIAYLGTALAIAAAVWFVARAKAPEPPRTASDRVAQQASIPVSAIEVRPTQVAMWLETTGTVRTELDSVLSTKVMGRVLRVAVREGDAVRRGQTLIELDARDLDAGIAEASANVRAAAAGYSSARVAARMEEAATTAGIAQAEAGVVQAQAAQKAAQARLDLVRSGPRKQERAQAALAVEQARAASILAEANLRRMESLLKEGAVSQQQHDATKTQYDVSRAQLDAARESRSIADEGSRAEDVRAAEEAVRQADAGIALARATLLQARAAALKVDVRKQEIQVAAAQSGQSKAGLLSARATRSYARVVAPFDGTVSARLVDPGALAAPGTPLLRIQGGAVRLEAVVPESALHAARLGARPEVVLDAYGPAPMRGVVTQIAPRGDPTSRTFVVKVDLPAGAAPRTGMFGRARFMTGTQRSLVVPSTAIVEREGLCYVYVTDAGNVARLRIVTTGRPAPSGVPILSGLAEGDHVIVANTAKLTDGAKVTVQ